MDRKGNGKEIQGGVRVQGFLDPQHISRGTDEMKRLILERMRRRFCKAIFSEELFALEGNNEAKIWRESVNAHGFATITSTTSKERDQSASTSMCKSPEMGSEAKGAGSCSDHKKKDTGMVIVDAGNYVPMRKEISNLPKTAE